MLGYESERRLKNLLVAIGDGERDLEAARQRLCSIRDFAPRSMHYRIDRDGSGRLTADEICNFCRDNAVFHISASEAHSLIQFFDSDGRGGLNPDEFSQLCLPCEDNYLRSSTQLRPARFIGRFDVLPRDIEQAMTSVIEKEISLQRRLESLKRECELQYDYTQYAAFRSVDRYSQGRLDTINIGTFLRQQGHYASELELLAIVRRMDTDGDASVNLSEFCEFVRPIIPVPRPFPSPPPPRQMSPMRSNTSPMRTSSPARAQSAGRPMMMSTPSPPRASYSPARASPSRKVTLRPLAEDDLVASLKEQCNLEAELERAKINLANKTDFNIGDCFNIFDVPRYGSIDQYQLQRGLQEIGIFASIDECGLIVNRYDASGDRRLQFHEVSKAMCAYDAYYSGMVSRRPANYPPPYPPLRRDSCFRADTAFEHQSMWRTHIRCENAAEALRQRLNSRPDFNAYEAFNSLDLNEDGRVSANEIQRMIESRGYYVGRKEIDQVVEKMDKNKDRTVSYGEFADESRNKSPARR